MTKSNKYWENIKKRWDLLHEKALAAIEHPHFEYACIDNVNNIIYIKPKPFWKWFSGKKIVTVKIVKFNCPLFEYTRRENDHE